MMFVSDTAWFLLKFSVTCADQLLLMVSPTESQERYRYRRKRTISSNVSFAL